MAIQLYGFWRSNAAFRVRVALNLKGLPFEEIDVDILAGEQFAPAYSGVNAERVVPTLVHEGHRIFQSLAIIEYIDEIHPEPRLVPRDLKERANARALAMVLVADAHPLTVPRVRNQLGGRFGASPEAIESWCRHWTSEGLATYERLLAERPPDPFALGADVSIADICIAGQAALADVYGMALSPFPLVAKISTHCFELPAFSRAHPFKQPGYRALQDHSLDRSRQ